VGVRGSDEDQQDGQGYGDTVNAVRQIILRDFPGSVANHFIEYPAIPVFYGGVLYRENYPRSVNEGKNALSSFLNSFHTRCPTSFIALVGYSQGAHVAGDVFQEIRQSVRDKITAMALFGDPRFNPRQSKVSLGGNGGLAGSWAAPWPGANGELRSFHSEDFDAVHSYCHEYDPVCNFSPANLSPCLAGYYCIHTHYIDFSYPTEAAKWILSRTPTEPSRCSPSATCVSAWGDNAFGTSGDGTKTDSSIPVSVHGLSAMTAIAAGGIHNMALHRDGTVSAWGDNLFGMLGDGTLTDSLTPVKVSGLSRVTAIAAGVGYSLALRRDGTVWAWGYNGEGELGNGTTTNSTKPVRVRGLAEVTAIATGSDHSLALRSDGTVWAWGENTFGVLGNGTTTRSLTPVKIRDLNRVTDITAGDGTNLALRRDGTVWFWGADRSRGVGELGPLPRIVRTPVKISGLSGVTGIAAGPAHCLALRHDGTVWAWGYNGTGAIGNGTTTNALTPVRVSGLTRVTAIAAGAYYSMALRTNGRVVAWGDNGAGQLGNGATTGSLTPVNVSGLSGVTAIAAEIYHSLALHV
jgi:alpha-tubulin suppressor-like RCC1 family protein